MTEARFFKLLSNINENDSLNNDYPKLQSETAGVLSSNLTDIVYDALKSKSSSDSFKKANVLRFINLLCEETDAHVTDESYHKFYFDSLKSFYVRKNGNLEDFLKCNQSELNSLKCSELTENIAKFYTRKNSVNKQITREIEHMKKYDSDKLAGKVQCQVRKPRFYYETNESTIKHLLGEETEGKKVENISLGFRERQIKLAYALLNVSYESSMDIIQEILRKLSNYRDYQSFEIDFLFYLWRKTENFTSYIIETFPFVYEKLLLKLCKDAIKLDNESEVSKYFSELNHDVNFVVLQKYCSVDREFCKTINNIVNELYYYGHCNVNLLRLSDAILRF